jgi:hypothetical protein
MTACQGEQVLDPQPYGIPNRHMTKYINSKKIALFSIQSKPSNRKSI